MSIINGLSTIAPAIGQIAKGLAQDTENENRLAERASLINRAPVVAAPDAVKPPPSPFVPTADSEAHGNALDAATVGRAHDVYQGLVARGLDPATAIGFAANAVLESRANPATGAGDMGASHGLMQWRGPRYEGFVGKFGDSTNLDDHLDYIMHEINGPEAKAWQAIQTAANDPAAKAAAVSQFFERPKNTVAEIARRSSIAQRLASQFLKDNG